MPMNEIPWKKDTEESTQLLLTTIKETTAQKEIESEAQI
jgi:hypothetical protein